MKLGQLIIDYIKAIKYGIEFAKYVRAEAAKVKAFDPNDTSQTKLTAAQEADIQKILTDIANGN